MNNAAHGPIMSQSKHSDAIYVSAFETYCDTGSYSEVARQMGISPTTAKRWSRIGGNIWREQNASAIAAVIERAS